MLWICSNLSDGLMLQSTVGNPDGACVGGIVGRAIGVDVGGGMAGASVSNG